MGISALIAFLNVDERCTVRGAVHGAICRVLSIAFGAICVSFARVTTFITSAVTIVFLASTWIEIVDHAFEIAVLNAIVVFTWLATLIAIAIENMCPAAFIALLACIAGASAKLANARLIVALKLVGYTALGTIIVHSALSAIIGADAIIIIYFAVLSTVWIRTLLIGISFLPGVTAIFAHVSCRSR